MIPFASEAMVVCARHAPSRAFIAAKALERASDAACMQKICGGGDGGGEGAGLAGAAAAAVCSPPAALGALLLLLLAEARTARRGSSWAWGRREISGVHR